MLKRVLEGMLVIALVAFAGCKAPEMAERISSNDDYEILGPADGADSQVGKPTGAAAKGKNSWLNAFKPSAPPQKATSPSTKQGSERAQKKDEKTAKPIPLSSHMRETLKRSEFRRNAKKPPVKRRPRPIAVEPGVRESTLPEPGSPEDAESVKTEETLAPSGNATAISTRESSEDPEIPEEAVSEKKTAPPSVPVEKASKEDDKPEDVDRDAVLDKIINWHYRELEKDPGNDKLRRALIDLHTLKGEIGKARKLSKEGDESAKMSFAEAVSKAKILVESGDVENASQVIAKLADELRPKSKLKLVNLRFCNSVRGFGMYDERKSNVFNRNDFFILYFEIRNFAQKQKGPQSFKASFSVGYRIKDEDGACRYERKNFAAVDYPTKTKIRDLNLVLSDYVPRNLPAGEYEMELFLTDRYKAYHKKAVATARFRVK